MEKEYELQKTVAPFNAWANRTFIITQDTFGYYKKDKREEAQRIHISELASLKLDKAESGLVLTIVCITETLQLLCKANDDKLVEIRDLLCILKRNYSIIIIDYFYFTSLEGGYNTREFKHNLSQYLSQKVFKQFSENFQRNESEIEKKTKAIWEAFKLYNFDYSEGGNTDVNPFEKIVFKNEEEALKVEFNPDDIDTVTKYFTTLMQMLVLIRKNQIECRFKRVASMEEARANYEDRMLLAQKAKEKRISNLKAHSSDMKAKVEKGKEKEPKAKGKEPKDKKKEPELKVMSIEPSIEQVKEPNDKVMNIEQVKEPELKKEEESKSEEMKKEQENTGDIKGESENNEESKGEKKNEPDNEMLIDNSKQEAKGNEEQTKEPESNIEEPKKDNKEEAHSKEPEIPKEVVDNKEEPKQESNSNSIVPKEELKEKTIAPIIELETTSTVLQAIKSEEESIKTIEKLKEENKSLRDTLFKCLDSYSKQKERLKRFLIKTHIKTYSCYNCGNLLQLIEATQPSCEYDSNCTQNSLFYCIKCNVNFCTYCIIYQRNSKCAQNHRLFPSKELNLCLLCENSESKTYFSCEHCNVAVCSKCYGERQTKEINCYNCTMELVWRKEVYAQCNKCLNVKDCFWGCSNCEYSLCLRCIPTSKGFCGAAHKLDQFNLEKSWFDMTIDAKMQFSHSLYLRFMGKCMKCDEIINGIGHCCSRCSYFICQKCYEE